MQSLRVRQAGTFTYSYLLLFSLCLAICGVYCAVNSLPPPPPPPPTIREFSVHIVVFA